MLDDDQHPRQVTGGQSAGRDCDHGGVDRFPVFLSLDGRKAVVVGGGNVALRRTRALLDAGATVTVVAPEVHDDLAALDVDVARRAFSPADLDGAWLVLACADDPQVNAVVAAAAEERRIWCSRADDAVSSAAWVPAAAIVDDVHVAVTAGGDPRRAMALRDAAARALHAGEWHARPQRPADGRVVLVGGGPGDAGLLTLRGYRALLDAHVVVVDRLAPTGLVDLLPSDVEVVDVGKDPRGAATSQDDINELIVSRARAGQTVVRLKGGDPFVLGRGSEEVEACIAAGVQVDVVPGVTSATAAATIAGIPLTKRGVVQHFSVVSGHVPPGDPRSSVDWSRLGQDNGTLVLMMAVANLGPIADALIGAGRDPNTPAVIIENATMPAQRILRAPLVDVARFAEDNDVVPPAIVVIGAVASAVASAAANDPRPGAGDARS
jgi:uroporphyrin-III C-methyltransferase/precorrin-2 dehydrogenase/sirohydrochlorin ferrochelatase